MIRGNLQSELIMKECENHKTAIFNIFKSKEVENGRNKALSAASKKI
jgi:hypothetical protein